MKTNKKLYIIIATMMFLLSIATIGSIAFQFQKFGFEKAKESAANTAKSVREGLTAHMVNGTMDKRDLFISNMSKLNKIENLRVIRSNSVIQQFGPGRVGESSYDKIDKIVLNTGEPYFALNKNRIEDYLRVTIPYIVTETSNPNCLNCHKARMGNVLGAISMEVSLEDVKKESIEAIIKTSAIVLIFLLISILIANHYIKPYIKLFDDLEDGISKAYHGDFSYHISTSLENEAGEVAKRLNELSDIFLFKKTIEYDKDKESIYGRIIHILSSHFSFKHFYFFEVDNSTFEKTSVFSAEKNKFSKLIKFKQVNECRAFRIKKPVSSNEFNNICGNCCDSCDHYFCYPTNIGNGKTLILHIELDSSDEIRKIDEYLPIIRNYINTAKPVIETKLLMEALEETTLKDPLTNLWNRRFLENFIASSLGEKSKYAVLMLDIDYFKTVNDTYGHNIGDDVIKGFGQVIQRNIKGNDIAVRYGGEEFTVILFNISEENALHVADNIRREFKKIVFKSENDTFTKTASVGIAVYGGENNHWQIIKSADVALYNAKDRGRDQVIIYDDSLKDKTKK